MTHLRKTLFAAALTALTGSALAATPAAAPTSTTPSKTTAKADVIKHKHVARAKKREDKSATQKTGSEGGKG